ncbi:Hypothetical predicted protein [Mytilus galloprovincialis]|uniref:Fibrinogen C-terminal domain-containing protein n=1 Tax=Mytilus galloprovincialis TaxID=29158 RepID=A0A8B6EZR8_MYTGA|nr:Hypothetical predicted protein [Mytilus galloprovincialis]
MIKTENVHICLTSCYDHIDCRSIAYNNKDKRCQLFNRNFQNQNSAGVGFSNAGWRHYDVSQGSCKVGLTTARDCSEVQSQGHDCSGVYTIKPSSTSTVQVWCDLHTDGGRWTVVQRRQDGSVDFDRNWVNYRAGFGAPHTEYWIGNENLFGLTSSGKTELLILMETWNGVWRYARYSEFWINNESDKYRLGLVGYSGTAGDSLLKTILLHNRQDVSSVLVIETTTNSMMEFVRTLFAEDSGTTCALWQPSMGIITALLLRGFLLVIGTHSNIKNRLRQFT